MLDWLMVNTLSGKNEDRLRRLPSARKTKVVSNFRYPSRDNAAVALVGISRSVVSRKFPVENDVFSIGASSDNDSVISDNNYLTGFHAALRYDNGSFWVVDQRSRNETFINDIKLKQAPLILNVGDRICIGNAGFKLMPLAGW